MKHPFTAFALGVALQFVRPAYAESITPADKTIVFVCVHGSVESQIAAAYFNGIVIGLPYYAAARDAIARRIDDLMPALAALRARPGKTVRGMIAGTDEGRDRITLRVPNQDSEDFRIEAFKVQDGLVFNAVRFGDQVEVTVENIDGARTIVALKKE